MEFADWLMEKLRRRGWPNSELANRGEVSASMVSMVLSGQTNPGVEFCRGVARALDLPAALVFRKAGLLPKEPTTHDELMEELRFLVNQMTRDQSEDLLAQAHAIVEARKRREERAKKHGNDEPLPSAAT